MDGRTSLRLTLVAGVRRDFPSRVEGWLNVSEPGERQRARWRTPVWTPYYCVLLQDSRRFSLYPREEMSIGERLELPRVRLDGGRQAFRRRWGYDQAPPLPEEDEEDSDLSETTSLRDERLLRFSTFECSTTYDKNAVPRRGSAPTTPVLGPPRPPSMDTPSRFATFFSKRSFKSTTNPLKRTKSVTKLERKRSTLDGDSVTPSRLRTSRSHESLLQSTPLVAMELGRAVVAVSALHPSLLGQPHCFQLTTAQEGTKYYSCRTDEERDRWVYSLRNTIHPNQDAIRRTENNLKIWILEAKGVSLKKRYFCEIYLDKVLYAKTSSRQKAEMCFWGEHFEFDHLPSFEQVNIHIYREPDKKKRREKCQLIGTVSIPVSSIKSRMLVEKWYPVVMDKSNGMKDSPSIRIKSRYQSIDVLPLGVYHNFLQYIKSNFMTICELMEPIISIRVKEDMATYLVKIMQRQGLAKQFLADIVMAEIDKIDDSHLTFRGNSLATKSTEAYMKLLGLRYLQDTLGNLLRTVLDSDEDCEVDHMKVTNTANLQRQQTSLMTFVEMAWVKIINSSTHFPRELQEVFHEYQDRLRAMGKEELGENLISASIFLRFLCPAILSPSLFNLTQEYPQGRAARNLTLIAKTIQTLANFTQFGGKEEFMEFMNEFVQREWSSMKAFLKQISSPCNGTRDRYSECDPHIDLGYQLALLHSLLAEWLPRVKNGERLAQLEKLVSDISTLLSARQGVTTPDKAVTLPRSSMVVGGRRAAPDLTTADDYVLFSALSPGEESGGLTNGGSAPATPDQPPSLSQLSEVSSSGYQSAQSPLAFSNPMYNFQRSSTVSMQSDITGTGSDSELSCRSPSPGPRASQDLNGNCTRQNRPECEVASPQPDVVTVSPCRTPQQEVEDLRRGMAELQTRLQTAQLQLRDSSKDTHMKNIITRLISVEEELQKEKQEMQTIILAKQKIIEAQERKIQALDATNSRLISALKQRNGTTDPLKVALLETAAEVRYKTSSC